MSNVFVCSDTHFGHDRAFLYEPRGFSSVEEHDVEVIRRWNEVVKPEDTVWHLGDVMLGDNEHGMECLRQLNGTIYIVPGNHDTPTRLALYDTLDNVHVIQPAVGGVVIPGVVAGAIYFKYKKYNFYLSHHPTMTSNLDFDKPIKARLINLAGHVHTKNKFEDMEKGLIYHVELDAQNNYPVNIERIIEEINNFGHK